MKIIKMRRMEKTRNEKTMKKTIILILICYGMLLVPNVIADDTGTYQIQNYNVVLTPHYNGDITISYEQKWLVTGGHIPWVTVGLPTSNYDIQDFGGAAKTVKSDNQGSWDGVRVDLDHDYQPQENFGFNFTIVQHGLMEKSGEGYRLVYTPGWYDRAFTDELTIKLVSPAKVNELKTDPQPNVISGQEVVWTRKNLGKGEKFTVSINFPNGTYNQTLMNKSAGGDIAWLIIVIFILAVLFLVGMAISSDHGSGYSGSSYSSDKRKRRHKEDDDGYTSPGIYSGVSAGSSHNHSSGGGGGFGGRSTSCACACVSCACACAGGGGGAGCKKSHHFCEKCFPKMKIIEDN